MKPRTAYQKHIVAIYNKGLRPITKQQKQWAFEHCIKHYAFRLKSGITTCSDCGHSWNMKDTQECKCPNCNAKLSVLNTLKRKESDSTYFSVLTTKKGLQVLRMFLLKVSYRKGEKAYQYFREIGQYWINDKGKFEVIGLKRTLGCYMDSFSYYAPMELRNDNEVFRYIAKFPVCPIYKVIPQIARTKFNGQFYEMAPLVFFSALLKDDRMGTLYKANRIAEFQYFANHLAELDTCWNSIKITLRNQYKIDDVSIWADYIQMLIMCGKDTRNAFYVCPDNLHQAHNDYVRKTMSFKELEETALKEDDFKKMKSRYFGLFFSDGEIEIKILESVREHYLEGKCMHHCVYSNRYYSKPNVLIFSARIDGRRIETIEVSLNSMRVEQCRGMFNKETEYHDRIVNLVNKNMKLIRSRMAA